MKTKTNQLFGSVKCQKIVNMPITVSLTQGHIFKLCFFESNEKKKTSQSLTFACKNDINWNE